MTISDFGILPGGKKVQRIELRSDTLRVTLLTLGAILQDVRLQGVNHGLTPGSNRLADYLSDMRYHGALIGPVVNRLSNAAAPIAGRLHHFDANQDGLHTLHSGKAGTHLQVWTIARVTESAVTLTLTLPDGAGGFPGNRLVCATFELAETATLRLTITATTDRATVFNAANHSYWNLDGSADWSGHALQISADRYLPTTDAVVPTGEIRATAGSAFDFRQPRVIRPGEPWLDTNFCLADGQRLLTQALILTGKSGVSMTLATTEPGVQIYDGRAAIRPGHAAFEGLAIEAQGWPDAPNRPGFPGIDLAAGQTRTQITEWRFAAPS